MRPRWLQAARPPKRETHLPKRPIDAHMAKTGKRETRNAVLFTCCQNGQNVKTTKQQNTTTKR